MDVRAPSAPAGVGAALISSCGSDSSDNGNGGASTTATAEETSSQKSKPARIDGTTIKLGDSQFGRVLFDRRGQAIYLFDKESRSGATATARAPQRGPPLLTQGKPQAANGAEERLLGTTRRRDGKTQVTYAGHPLYFYAHEGRNEVTCHNVREFGGLWLVLDRDGIVLG